MTERLRGLLEPDQFNYSFLINLDAHAHLHVIPRYRTPREFLGLTFVDAEGGGERRLAAGDHARLRSALREALSS